jgi:hypothetical protein
MGRVYGTHGRKEKCLRGFGGKTRRKETPGRHRCKWGGGGGGVIFKMYLTEIRLKDVNCVHLAQDGAFVNMLMNLQVT